jgi:hypothetical protein
MTDPNRPERLNRIGQVVMNVKFSENSYLPGGVKDLKKKEKILLDFVHKRYVVCNTNV